MSALHSHSYFDCFWGESCLFSLCAILYSYCILTFISHFPFSSLSLFLQLLLFFVWKLFSKKELMILLLLLLHICLYFVYYRAWIHKISKKASHFEDLIQATFSVPDFPKQKFPLSCSLCHYYLPLIELSCLLFCRCHIGVNRTLFIQFRKHWELIPN